MNAHQNDSHGKRHNANLSDSRQNDFCSEPSETPPSLSVRDRRVLWVGTAPILFNLFHGPTRPEDIQIILLCPEPATAGDHLPAGPFPFSYTVALGPQGIQACTIADDLNSTVSLLETCPTMACIAQWDLFSLLGHGVAKLLDQQPPSYTQASLAPGHVKRPGTCYSISRPSRRCPVLLLISLYDVTDLVITL